MKITGSFWVYKRPENAPEGVLRAVAKPPGPSAGAWLKRFTALDDKPRAASSNSEFKNHCRKDEETY